MSVSLIHPDAMPLFLRLLRGLDELEQDGRTVPCRVNPDPFTSDDRAERAGAGQACAACPAREMCGQYADANNETWGTWAGVDRTPTGRPNTKKGTKQ